MTTVDLKVLDGEELATLGGMDFEAGNLTDALCKLKLAVTEFDEKSALAPLGRLYAKLGLYEKSQQVLSKHIAEHPTDIFERFNFAMTFFDTGALERAYELMEEVLSQESEYPAARFYQAVILFDWGKLDDAMANVDGLLNDMPEDNLYHQRSLTLKKDIESRRVAA